jgi:uncharacterized protein YjbJ (UPF0337 family)
MNRPDAKRVLILATGARSGLGSQNGMGIHAQLEKPRRRSTEMTDLHATGATNKAKGQVEEGLGKLTGDRRQETKGKVKQVEGSAQQSVADIQDAGRQPSTRR